MIQASRDPIVESEGCAGRKRGVFQEQIVLTGTGSTEHSVPYDPFSDPFFNPLSPWKNMTSIVDGTNSVETGSYVTEFNSTVAIRIVYRVKGQTQDTEFVAARILPELPFFVLNGVHGDEYNLYVLDMGNAILVWAKNEAENHALFFFEFCNRVDCQGDAILNSSVPVETLLIQRHYSRR